MTKIFEHFEKQRCKKFRKVEQKSRPLETENRQMKNKVKPHVLRVTAKACLAVVGFSIAWHYTHARKLF